MDGWIIFAFMAGTVFGIAIASLGHAIKDAERGAPAGWVGAAMNAGPPNDALAGSPWLWQLVPGREG